VDDQIAQMEGPENTQIASLRAELLALRALVDPTLRGGTAVEARGDEGPAGSPHPDPQPLLDLGGGDLSLGRAAAAPTTATRDSDEGSDTDTVSTASHISTDSHDEDSCNLFSPKQQKLLKQLAKSGSAPGGIKFVLSCSEGCGPESNAAAIMECTRDASSFTTAQATKIATLDTLLQQVNASFVEPLLQHVGEKITISFIKALMELLDKHFRPFNLTVSILLKTSFRGIMIHLGEPTLHRPDSFDGEGRERLSFGNADCFTLPLNLSQEFRYNLASPPELVEFEIAMATEVASFLHTTRRISPELVYHLTTVLKCQEILGRTLIAYFQRVVAIAGPHAPKYVLILRNIERLEKSLASGVLVTDPHQVVSAYDMLARRYVPHSLPSLGAYVAQTATQTLPFEATPADFLLLGDLVKFTFLPLESVDVASHRFNQLVEAVQLAFSFDPHGFVFSQEQLVVLFSTAFKATLETGMPNETNLRLLLARIKACKTLLKVDEVLNAAFRDDMLKLTCPDSPAADSAPSTFAAHGSTTSANPKSDKPKKPKAKGADKQPSPPPPPPRPAPTQDSQQPASAKKEHQKKVPAKPAPTSRPPSPTSTASKDGDAKRTPVPISTALQAVSEAILAAGERVEHFLCKVSVGTRDIVVLKMDASGSLIRLDVPMNKFQKHPSRRAGFLL